LLVNEKEKDAEIERLRDTIAKMENAFVMRANAERELLEEALESYKSLLTRAADKIEHTTSSLDFVSRQVWEAYEIPELIQELRKAAE
jgi:hypothetical protein